MRSAFYAAALAALFFLSAFTALSEAAIVSLPRHRIKKIIAFRKNLSELFVKWLRYPQDFMTTILVGDTLVTMFLGIFATFFALDLLEHLGLPFNRTGAELAVWVLTTASVLVFCELAPKIFGRNNPERTSVVVIRVVNAASILLKPAMRPVLWLVDALTGTGRGIPASRLTSLTVEDLRTAVFESSRKGGLESETTKLFEAILKIPKMKVRKVMVPVSRMSAVDVSADKEEVVRRLIETGRSRVPVYSSDRNRITGVVLIKDLISSKPGSPVEFSEELVRPAITVKPEGMVCDLLAEFQKGSAHIAAVVDKKGVLKGIAALEDILKEIIGEVLDEYDFARKTIK
jgi:CBS domain containing-hemolysin-like protein